MKHTIKSIAACAMMAWASAHAGVIGTIENQAGGKINLTDAKGSCSSGKLVIASSPGQEAIFGCWSFDADQVFVKYESGKVYVYPADTVIMAPTKQRQGTAL